MKSFSHSSFYIWEERAEPIFSSNLATRNSCIYEYISITIRYDRSSYKFQVWKTRIKHACIDIQFIQDLVPFSHTQ
jgi:hypothetical protein